MPQPDGDSDGEDDGRTATFPFLNQLFGAGAAGGDAEPKKDAAPGRTRTAARGRSAP